MLLIDSTIYLNLLKSLRDPVEVLKYWIERDEILTCGIIRCQVLRSIINKKVYRRMETLFNVVVTAPITEKTWKVAAELAWKLDRQGIILPLDVLIIAICAGRFKATVITNDPYFEKVPDLRTSFDLPNSPSQPQ
ncbi:MAG: hypothetical protein DRP87_11365 [Spirochaetes bacterium]|nr:MAG: hypothetical protein DRP87_11365 [Spirochaetota bacterium]